MEDKEQIMIDGVDVTQFNSDELACMNRYDVARLFIGLVENLHRKTQECEELEEQLQANQPTGICETCMAKVVLQNDKYRKALEEIGDIVFGDYEIIDPLGKQQILNIINKAKGG